MTYLVAGFMAKVGTEIAKQWKVISKVGVYVGKLCSLVVIGTTMEGHTTEDSGCHGVREVPAVQHVAVTEWGLFHEHGNGL